LGLPDGVQRRLDLAEGARQGDQGGKDADERGHHAGFGIARALDHRLQRFGALAAHQAAQLLDDGAARGVVAEGQSGDGDGDQQDRRQREQRVVGDRGAAAQRIVLDKSLDGVPQQAPDVAQARRRRRIRHLDGETNAARGRSAGRSRES
jgi:hypothetical protein